MGWGPINTQAINSQGGGVQTVELSYLEHNVYISHTNPEDHIFKILLSTKGFYEQKLLEATSLFLSPGDVIIDAGANIGNHSIFWALNSGCKVFAYEPVPGIFDLLIENIVKNKLQRSIFPRRLALGATQGRAEIKSYDPNNIGATALTSNAPQGSIRVTDLDSELFCTKDPVRLLKIDVEGFELEVIGGARKIILRDSPIILCECPTESSYKTAAKTLDAYGYLPVERFNVTATYLFIHVSELLGGNELVMKYVRAAILRLSEDKFELSAKIARHTTLLQTMLERISILEKPNTSNDFQ